MPGRHHSAQELEFLKQAYSKGDRHAYGGHTLDLMDQELAKRYGGVDAAAFRKEFKEGIGAVEDALTAQKLAMSDAFVQMEYDRVNARKLDNAVARASIQTDASDALGPARGPETGQSRSSRAAKQRAREAVKRHDALQRGLAVINDELARLCPDGERARAAGPREDIPGARADDRDANRERRRLRRRRGDQGNEAATRLKVRSELEKRAQQITHAEALRIHVDSQYTSMHAKDFHRHDMVDVVLEPSFEANNFKNARNTRFAAARIVATDLFGERRF